MAVRTTPRDLRIMEGVALYQAITRLQLQCLIQMSERMARRRFKILAAEGYLNRYEPGVQIEIGRPPAPIYYPSRLGCQTLAEHFRDDSILATRTTLPQRFHIAHAISVTDTHIRLRAAIESQSQVSLVHWLNENVVVNPTAEPAGHRTTCMVFDELLGAKNATVCKPDSVFGLKQGDTSCIYFLEEERDLTHSAKQRVARKLPGYAKTLETLLHKSHFAEPFPGSIDTFRVLFVVPNDKRRDALVRAADRLTRDNPQLHEALRFVSKQDLSPDRFLFEPVFFPADTEASPLPLVNLRKAA